MEKILRAGKELSLSTLLIVACIIALIALAYIVLAYIALVYIALVCIALAYIGKYVIYPRYLIINIFIELEKKYGTIPPSHWITYLFTELNFDEFLWDDDDECKNFIDFALKNPDSPVLEKVFDMEIGRILTTKACILFNSPITELACGVVTTNLTDCSLYNLNRCSRLLATFISTIQLNNPHPFPESQKSMALKLREKIVKRKEKLEKERLENIVEELENLEKEERLEEERLEKERGLN